MEKEMVIKECIKALEAADAKVLINFFTDDAIVKSNIYGNMKISAYLKLFFSDNLNLKISLHKITQDPAHPNIVSVYFNFIWKVKEGQQITGETVEYVHFNSNNKVTYVTGEYNLIGLS